MACDTFVYTYKHIDVDTFVKRLDMIERIACNFIANNKGATYSINSYMSVEHKLEFTIELVFNVF